MFLELISVWHAVGSVVGCLTNLLLLYVALTKTPNQTKSYAILIINFAITDFTESLMDLFVQLRFIITPFDVTLIYIFNGLCQYTGVMSCKIGLSIFYHCFPHNVSRKIAYSSQAEPTKTISSISVPNRVCF
nr:hypothetical protein R03H4.8 - Caenorhabditis elegans [Caenorhabditis elegans]